MQPIRIMIVDDQNLFAEGLKHVIEGESQGRIKILGIAENGKKAVELVNELQPDVILMDIRMPVMDGVQATDIIHTKYPDIKIMILTTFDDEELVFDALSCGANGYVLKNIEPPDLIIAVNAVQTGAFYVSPSVGYRLIDAKKHSSYKSQPNTLISEILTKLPSLTIREAEIIEQVLKAQRNHEIAENLFISEKTVRNHISAIYDKLQIHNRLRLFHYMAELGITSHNDL